MGHRALFSSSEMFKRGEKFHLVARPTGMPSRGIAGSRSQAGDSRTGTSGSEEPTWKGGPRWSPRRSPSTELGSPHRTECPRASATRGRCPSFARCGRRAATRRAGTFGNAPANTPRVAPTREARPASASATTSPRRIARVRALSDLERRSRKRHRRAVLQRHATIHFAERRSIDVVTSSMRTAKASAQKA